MSILKRQLDLLDVVDKPVTAPVNVTERATLAPVTVDISWVIIGLICSVGLLLAIVGAMKGFNLFKK